MSSSAKSDPTGIVLPVDETGRRSSTSFGTSVVGDALRAVSTADAQAVLAEPKWRHRYPDHIVKLIEWSVADPGWAEAIAARGLRSLHHRLEFSRGDEIRPLDEAMGSADGRPFQPVSIDGTSTAPPELAVPYRGELLRGLQLRRQVAKWVDAEVASPSFASAMDELIDHPEWLDLSDQWIALLGAGAELGPFETLVGWRANLVAIDLPDIERARRLQHVAEGGNGTVVLPFRDGEFGADLVADTPEIAAFLADPDTTGGDAPICLGGHAYADGRAHLLVAAAMDAIEAEVTAHRPTSLAHLLTPTDVYAVPETTASKAQARWAARSFRLQVAQGPVRALSGGRAFRSQLGEVQTGKDGFRAGIVDSLVTQQGPNYALAKRIQGWRSIVARAAGQRVSAPVAPSTKTRSVTRNRALALAYRGANIFDVEVFEPATSNVLMAAMLARDLRTLTGPADPGVALTNPLELFQDAAFHGGLWTSPYQARSALAFATVAGLAKR